MTTSMDGMETGIRKVMTADPVCVSTKCSLEDAARAMRDSDIGTVIVIGENEQLRGMVTDRDLVVRGMAQGLDPVETPVEAICSAALVVLGPSDGIDDAITLMRENGLRRLPVVSGDQPIGIVSLGDLALERDPLSVLGSISSSLPNL